MKTHTKKLKLSQRTKLGDAQDLRSSLTLEDSHWSVDTEIDYKH